LRNLKAQKYRLCIIIGIIFSSIPFFSCLADFSGQVLIKTDREIFPANGIKINILYDGKSIVTYTDKEGKFSFPIKPQKLKVLVYFHTKFCRFGFITTSGAHSFYPPIIFTYTKNEVMKSQHIIKIEDDEQHIVKKIFKAINILSPIYEKFCTFFKLSQVFKEPLTFLYPTRYSFKFAPLYIKKKKSEEVIYLANHTIEELKLIRALLKFVYLRLLGETVFSRQIFLPLKRKKNQQEFKSEFSILDDAITKYIYCIVKGDLTSALKQIKEVMNWNEIRAKAKLDELRKKWEEAHKAYRIALKNKEPKAKRLKLFDVKNRALKKYKVFLNKYKIFQGIKKHENYSSVLAIILYSTPFYFQHTLFKYLKNLQEYSFNSFVLNLQKRLLHLKKQLKRLFPDIKIKTSGKAKDLKTLVSILQKNLQQRKREILKERKIRGKIPSSISRRKLEYLLFDNNSKKSSEHKKFKQPEENENITLTKIRKLLSSEKLITSEVMSIENKIMVDNIIKRIKTDEEKFKSEIGIYQKQLIANSQMILNKKELYYEDFVLNRRKIFEHIYSILQVPEDSSQPLKGAVADWLKKNMDIINSLKSSSARAMLIGTIFKSISKIKEVYYKTVRLSKKLSNKVKVLSLKNLQKVSLYLSKVKKQSQIPFEITSLRNELKNDIFFNNIKEFRKYIKDIIHLIKRNFKESEKLLLKYNIKPKSVYNISDTLTAIKNNIRAGLALKEVYAKDLYNLNQAFPKKYSKLKIILNKWNTILYQLTELLNDVKTFITCYEDLSMKLKLLSNIKKIMKLLKKYVDPAPLMRLKKVLFNNRIFIGRSLYSKFMKKVKEIEKNRKNIMEFKSEIENSIGPLKKIVDDLCPPDEFIRMTYFLNRIRRALYLLNEEAKNLLNRLSKIKERLIKTIKLEIVNISDINLLVELYKVVKEKSVKSKEVPPKKPLIEAVKIQQNKLKLLAGEKMSGYKIKKKKKEKHGISSRVLKNTTSKNLKGQPYFTKLTINNVLIEKIKGVLNLNLSEEEDEIYLKIRGELIPGRFKFESVYISIDNGETYDLASGIENFYLDVPILGEERVDLKLKAVTFDGIIFEKSFPGFNLKFSKPRVLPEERIKEVEKSQIKAVEMRQLSTKIKQKSATDIQAHSVVSFSAVEVFNKIMQAYKFRNLDELMNYVSNNYYAGKGKLKEDLRNYFDEITSMNIETEIIDKVDNQKITNITFAWQIRTDSFECDGISEMILRKENNTWKMIDIVGAKFFCVKE